MLIRTFSVTCLGVATAFSEDLLHWNGVGYETFGPKTIIIRNTSGAVSTTGFQIQDASGKTVFAGSTSAETRVTDWGNTAYKVCDFSSLVDSGDFRLVALPSGSKTSLFRIGREQTLRGGIASMVGYFNAMRSTSDDSRIGFYDQSWRGTRDVSGGWRDATGDVGKYISHLSWANHMNPQQIPLVAWTLMRTGIMAPKAVQAAGMTNALRSEATWGADYLMRILDPGGYFYINVFSPGWGGQSGKVICAWTTSSGTPNSDYQSALREGGGMSIAALALAARTGLSGAFTSAQYLQGAKMAFDSLTARPGRWADDGRDNLIDHYCALVAATELALATKDSRYVAFAGVRADSILGRQTSEGWYVSDNGSRAFYHAVDEGLPLVALWGYLQLDSTSARAARVRASLSKSVHWYRSLTRGVANPFLYPRMYASGWKRFFMPHDNETGYWWQGENARLGSMTAGLLLAGRGADPAWKFSPDDSLSQEGVAGIDWVQGKNSEGVNFIYSASNPSFDGYNGNRNLEGGICNGITAFSDSDPYPVFNSSPTDWQDWRWIEQWIPHNAWFLMGSAVIAFLQENPPHQPSAVQRTGPAGDAIRMKAESGRILAELPGNARWSLRDLAGRTVKRGEGTSIDWRVGGGTWIVEAITTTDRLRRIAVVAP